MLNGKVLTRMLLAIADSADGYNSVATQIYKSCCPVGNDLFGDGRGAVIALESKYRLDDESSAQEFCDQFGALIVT